MSPASSASLLRIPALLLYKDETMSPAVEPPGFEPVAVLEAMLWILCFLATDGSLWC
jgi:hypothetical protein